jgi:hypothetical protein
MIVDISLEIPHELGKDNTSQSNLVQIKSLHILYQRVFASAQHTFLAYVVYTSLISINVQRYVLDKTWAADLYLIYKLEPKARVCISDTDRMRMFYHT